MSATAVTLNDLEGHSPVAGLFKCNQSNVSGTFYTISTDTVLARFLCISRASCKFWRLGLKLPIHAHFLRGVWRTHFPQMSRTLRIFDFHIDHCMGLTTYIDIALPVTWIIGLNCVTLPPIGRALLRLNFSLQNNRL